MVEYARHIMHFFQSEIRQKNVSTHALRRHQELCYQIEDVVITIPKLGKNYHKFKNLTACWFLPRVIYFDLGFTALAS